MYQGIYRKTLRPCAVKVCKDFNVRNEVELLRKLRHPHIVQLEDAQKRGPVTFVVMELCQGGELFNLVIDQGRLDTQAAQKYFCQIASAVHYAHGLGIAHRDIKLENILLDHSLQNAKLADFGLSVELQLDSSNASEVCKDPCGSVRYAAPELFQPAARNGGYDPLKADVWSLGVCLFAMLTGEMPFSVASVSSEAYQAFKAHSTLPTEELLAPAVLSVAKSTLAIEVGARCGMASLMAMPWIAEGMRRFLPEQAVPSGRDACSISEGSNGMSISETSKSTVGLATSCVVGEGKTAKSSGRRSRVEEWELDSEDHAEELGSEELPPPAKVRRIGWAVHCAKTSVIKKIVEVLEGLSVPVQMDAAESRIEAGERGELTIGVSEDATGMAQVEWARTGADVNELKRLYKVVNDALNDFYGKGQCVHRYGKEVIDLHVSDE